MQLIRIRLHTVQDNRLMYHLFKCQGHRGRSNNGGYEVKCQIIRPPYIANARQPVPFTFQNPFTYPANARQPFTYNAQNPFTYPASYQNPFTYNARIHLHILRLIKVRLRIMHRTHSLIQQVVRVRSRIMHRIRLHIMQTQDKLVHIRHLLVNL